MRQNYSVLQEGVIYETITTTYNDKFKPNAAPMGIIRNNRNQIILQPFIQTDTYLNLLNMNVGVLNFSSDPLLFTLSSLFQEELVNEYFCSHRRINAPILKSCGNNYIAIEIIENKTNKKDERGLFYCKVIDFQLKGFSLPFTRAFSLLLEILIHSTRIINFSKIVEKEKHTIELFSIIDFHAQTLRRVAPNNSIYITMLDKVLLKILPFRES